MSCKFIDLHHCTFACDMSEDKQEVKNKHKMKMK